MPIQDNFDPVRKPRWWLLAAALSGAVAWRALAGFQVMAATFGDPMSGDHPLPLFFAHVLEGILLGVVSGVILAYTFSIRPTPSLPRD